MQWGIHHPTAACKCQQKRDILTLHQGQYQSWRQCATPQYVLMPLSRSVQPNWPAHWPWSCQYQTHCLPWIPYTSIWCTPWAHHLAARLPWCLAPQGKLALVCCRHPGACHPGSAHKWKNWQSWRWIVPSQSGDLAHILHLFPLQQPQSSLLWPLKQPSLLGPLMTW